jgi:hypothetical protein
MESSSREVMQFFIEALLQIEERRERHLLQIEEQRERHLLQIEERKERRLFQIAERKERHLLQIGERLESILTQLFTPLATQKRIEPPSFDRDVDSYVPPEKRSQWPA